MRFLIMCLACLVFFITGAYNGYRATRDSICKELGKYTDIKECEAYWREND